METKPTPPPVGAKPDIQLQNAAIIADAKATAAQEQKLIDTEKAKQANALSSALKVAPTPPPQRPGLLERKEVTVIITPGQRPEVTFKGEWNGKFVMTAGNAIARAYRHRKQVVLNPIKRG